MKRVRRKTLFFRILLKARVFILRMKKLFLSFLVIVSFTAYALNKRMDAESASSDSGLLDRTLLTQMNTASVGTQQEVGLYKNGTYQGSAENAYYGDVRIRAVVEGGKISNISFLDYPRDLGTSVQINQRAMPILRSEAIQSQSADVDVVSGATLTSEAFIRSLASALAQANK